MISGAGTLAAFLQDGHEVSRLGFSRLFHLLSRNVGFRTGAMYYI
jgi:hypothetical protein